MKQILLVVACMFLLVIIIVSQTSTIAQANEINKIKEKIRRFRYGKRKNRPARFKLQLYAV